MLTIIRDISSEVRFIFAINTTLILSDCNLHKDAKIIVMNGKLRLYRTKVNEGQCDVVSSVVISEEVVSSGFAIDENKFISAPSSGVSGETIQDHGKINTLLDLWIREFFMPIPQSKPKEKFFIESSEITQSPVFTYSGPNLFGLQSQLCLGFNPIDVCTIYTEQFICFKEVDHLEQIEPKFADDTPGDITQLLQALLKKTSIDHVGKTLRLIILALESKEGLMRARISLNQEVGATQLKPEKEVLYRYMVIEPDDVSRSRQSPSFLFPEPKVYRNIYTTKVAADIPVNHDGITSTRKVTLLFGRAEVISDAEEKVVTEAVPPQLVISS